MRLLVTGSSGWLGRFACPAFTTAGHTVVGLDIAPGPHTTIVGSVADCALVDRVFAEHGIEAVIHCGGLHKPDIARFPAQAFVDTNVTGTLNLLQAAVAAGHDRFVFTSTTSLMISQAIRDEVSDKAVWLDENTGPLEPRNIYGVTKLAAEGLCRQHFLEHGLASVVLRTSRFFPEDDDTHATPSGPNLKANEFLNRRLTVEDVVRAHEVALKKAPDVGFDIAIVSAPPPFSTDDATELKTNAAAVIRRYFPEVDEIYRRRGWTLPQSIGRVYDSAHAERSLGFRCQTDFAAVLDAVRNDAVLPFAHDAGYAGPQAEVARDNT